RGRRTATEIRRRRCSGLGRGAWTIPARSQGQAEAQKTAGQGGGAEACHQSSLSGNTEIQQAQRTAKLGGCLQSSVLGGAGRPQPRADRRGSPLALAVISFNLRPCMADSG